jgi:hypothetical protein
MVAIAAISLVACGRRYSTRLEPGCPAAKATTRVMSVAATTAVRGVVRDRDTGSPLQHASVELLPGIRYATTDSSGVFAFPEVASGRYVLRTRRIGYEARHDTIAIKKLTGIDAQLALTPASVDRCFEVIEIRTPRPWWHVW